MYRIRPAARRRRRAAAFLLGGVLAMVALSAPAEAQFQGAWIPPDGTITARLWFAGQDNSAWFCGSDRIHCSPGARTVASELTDRERSTTYSAGARVEGAVTDWLALNVELPFHAISYERYIQGRKRPVDDLETRGVGDAGAGARIGTTHGSWGFSGGYRMGFPTGDFSISAFIVPVGQGSRTHDVFLELGRSLHPTSGYVEVGALYRIRETFASDGGVEVRWGNELYGRLAGGHRLLGGLWAKGEAGLFTSGRRTTNIAGEVPGEARRSFFLSPGLFWTRSPLTLDAWIQISLSGRNVPADPTVGTTVSVRWREERS